MTKLDLLLRDLAQWLQAEALLRRYRLLPLPGPVEIEGLDGRVSFASVEEIQAYADRQRDQLAALGLGQP